MALLTKGAAALVPLSVTEARRFQGWRDIFAWRA